MSETIIESYTLPSKGLIYTSPISPTFTLRSMTTEDEMKRQSPSEASYKVMADIIQSCLTEKLKTHVYDLHVGDYQYLLYKLRTVTYGNDYKVTVRCPHCGALSKVSINMDDLQVVEFDGSVKDLTAVHLPVSDIDVELTFQTPRILDNIERRKREIAKKSSEKTYDPTFMLSIMSLIKTVDGKQLTQPELEMFVRKLPLRDANLIVNMGDKLNRAVGVNTDVTVTCPQCGNDIDTTFRVTQEFFGPTID